MNDWKNALQQLKDSGSLPEASEETQQSATEKESAYPSSHRGKLHIAVEKKGRGGKTATIVYDFNGTADELQVLAKTLRQRLGTGGSARDGEILLQGDRKEAVTEMLRSLGYKV